MGRNRKILLLAYSESGKKKKCTGDATKEAIGLNVLHEILEFDATFHETLPKDLT